jgi:hypothetical protein
MSNLGLPFTIKEDPITGRPVVVNTRTGERTPVTRGYVEERTHTGPEGTHTELVRGVETEPMVVGEGLSAGARSGNAMGETPTTIAGSPSIIGNEARQRVECFLLGARIHDHVGDMLKALEEMDEAKVGEDALMGDAGKWFHDLSTMTGREVSDAGDLGCVPEEVQQLYDETTIHAPGDPALNAALYALAVKLGDPPLLRNIRRVEMTRGEHKG